MRSRVIFVVAIRLFFLMEMAIILPWSSIAQASEDWKALVVLSSDKSEETKQAKEQLAQTLASVVPPNGKKQISAIINGRYVLYGDLFWHKKTYALVELTSGLSLGWANSDNTTIGVGFAVWNGKKWEPRVFLRISPVWRKSEWIESEEERFPIRPAEKPFEMLQVAPEQPPLAIVVGDVWKYWQEHFIVAFDPATESLSVLDQTKHAEPVHGYLRLFSDSGHRSTFVEWKFTTWTGEKLLPRAFWHEGVDEATDGTICNATSYDLGTQKPVEYLMEVNPNSSLVSVTRNGKWYAQMDIKPMSPDSDLHGPLTAYLFEKATGLPRDLYPNVWKGKQPDRLEGISKIFVTGEAEAVRKFSSAKSK